jgi:hypothetical protein
LNGLKYQWPKKAVFFKSLLNFESLMMVPTTYCSTGYCSGGRERERAVVWSVGVIGGHALGSRPCAQATEVHQVAEIVTGCEGFQN